MQTFLPHPDFTASAAALDRGRLGKQRVETVQILRALVWPVYGWKNHPAVAMWRGFTPALTLYGLAICERWTTLGHADSVSAQLLAFTDGQVPDPRDLAATGQLPPWLGNPDLHRSHQSALLRKDPTHYRPVFGDEVPDDLPYSWPLPAYPRWPVRRGHSNPLTTFAASELLGIDPDPAEADLVWRVQEGEAVVLGGDDPARRRSVALLAGLCLPGRTAWITPAPLPELTPVDLAAVPDPHHGTGRQPDPAALAAMAAENEVPPDVVFLRAGTTPPPDTGLVVREQGCELHLSPRPQDSCPPASAGEHRDGAASRR